MITKQNFSIADVAKMLGEPADYILKLIKADQLTGSHYRGVDEPRVTLIALQQYQCNTGKPVRFGAVS